MLVNWPVVLISYMLSFIISNGHDTFQFSSPNTIATDINKTFSIKIMKKYITQKIPANNVRQGD